MAGVKGSRGVDSCGEKAAESSSGNNNTGGGVPSEFCGRHVRVTRTPFTLPVFLKSYPFFTLYSPLAPTTSSQGIRVAINLP